MNTFIYSSEYFFIFHIYFYIYIYSKKVGKKKLFKKNIFIIKFYNKNDYLPCATKDHETPSLIGEDLILFEQLLLELTLILLLILIFCIFSFI